MKLSQYAVKVLAAAATLNHYEADSYRAADSLVRPFERLQSLRKSAEELKPVALYDEVAARKLEELQKKIQHNESVASRLEAVCGKLGMTDDFSLRALYQRKAALLEDSKWADLYHNQDIRPYQDAATRMGVEYGTVLQHPEVARLKAVRDAKIAANDKEIIELNQKIDALEGILRNFKW